MFLDIQMLQLIGIDFLCLLVNLLVVIFIIVYFNYVVDGFEFNVIDYLLKLILLECFLKVVNKVIEQIEFLCKGKEGVVLVVVVVSEFEIDFMFVKVDKKLVCVYYYDVVYIEGLKDYVIICQMDSCIVILQIMKSLEMKLLVNIFCCIYCFYIVNINKIDVVMGNMVEVQEKGQVKYLFVGKNYWDELLEFIN